MDVLGRRADRRVERSLHLGRHVGSLEAFLRGEELGDLALDRLQRVTGENLGEFKLLLNLGGVDGEIVAKVGKVHAGFLVHDGGSRHTRGVRDGFQRLAHDLERVPFLEDVSLLDAVAFHGGGAGDLGDLRELRKRQVSIRDWPREHVRKVLGREGMVAREVLQAGDQRGDPRLHRVGRDHRRELAEELKHRREIDTLLVERLVGHKREKLRDALAVVREPDPLLHGIDRSLLILVVEEVLDDELTFLLVLLLGHLRRRLWRLWFLLGGGFLGVRDRG